MGTSACECVRPRLCLHVRIRAGRRSHLHVARFAASSKVSAGVLEETLRRNFDARVTRTLSAGGFGNAQRMVEGFIAEE
eukprot:4561510-Pleurochrysis_carterae.AAC.1